MKTLLWDGNIYDVRNPGADPRLTIETLYYALSRIERWNGQLSFFQTVSKHSVAMAEAAETPLDALACLWHDVPEVFLGDMNSQIKRQPEMRWFRDLERDCLQSLVNRFVPVLSDYDWSRIRYLDEASARTEIHYGAPQTDDVKAWSAFGGFLLTDRTFSSWLVLHTLLSEELEK